MGLLAPLSLIWLLPLAGAVIVLYLLKLKRKERIVSSVFLWRQAVQDVQANAPFQKLRKNLLLFIQLAVLVLAIAALARPFARTAGLAGQNIVLIIDSSASMKATDVSRSRFDEAKRLAAGTVERMGRGDSMLVITASAKTRVASSFTTDRKSLSASIAALEAKDTRANLREAMVLALSLVAKKKNPRIVVISDGGFAPVDDIDPGRANISFIRVGKRSDNVGLVALDSRKAVSGAQQVFIGLKSFSDRTRDFSMEVYINDRLFDIREESLRPKEMKQEILSGLPETSGRVTVKLDINDDLAADNSGSVYLTRPKRISVLLVTKGNLFLEHAFNLDPNTEVVKAAEVPEALRLRSAWPYDIAVFDGVKPPDRLPRSGYLLINTDCKAAPARLSKVLNHPSIADWQRRHPITAYVDFSTVRMSGARTLAVENWGQDLIEAENGTIAAAGESEAGRFVVLGWNLLESDFPLRVGFPIFITNCIEWLSGRAGEAANIAARTGEVVPIQSVGAGRLVVTDPSAKSTTLSATGGSAYFDGTELAGVYRIKAGKQTREFACNLLAPDESDISPRGKISIGERNVTGSTGTIKTNREFWRTILVVALALLTFEWYAFHRRVA